MRTGQIPGPELRQGQVRRGGRAVAPLVLTAAVALATAVAAAAAADPAKPPAAGDPGKPPASAEPAKPPAGAAAEVPDKLAIPESDRNRKNPVPNVPEARESGKRTFSSNCAKCHGSVGDGSGEMSQKMHWRIPNFSSREFQASWTDGELFYILSHGHGAMPSHKITDEKKWEVILHVRTLAPSAAAPPK